MTAENKPDPEKVGILLMHALEFVENRFLESLVPIVAEEVKPVPEPVTAVPTAAAS